MSVRKIIHVDLDCFYAAVECRDDPSIAHLPVGVGGVGGRGVLTTCNYVARRFGCRSAMPVFQARRLCPGLVLRPVRFEAYRRDSHRIREIFRDYTPLIEPLSLDEAYLDVTGRVESAWATAGEIRRRIRDELGLTASAGVAGNKMLAKIASDWRKPDGQFAVTPDRVAAFMRQLPVRRLPGIGPRAQERLAAHGIETCGDLQAVPRHRLAGWIGASWAADLIDRAHGHDDRPLEIGRARKSMSSEHTFFAPLRSLAACREALERLRREVTDDLARHRDLPPIRKIFVKVKFTDFRSTTREENAEAVDPRAAAELLEEAYGRSPLPVRLIGFGVRFATGEEPDGRQLCFPWGEVSGGQRKV